MTDCQPILSLNLANCRKEQLQFESEFVLTARRNDFVHALVAYFDCQFSQVGGVKSERGTRGRGWGGGIVWQGIAVQKRSGSVGLDLLPGGVVAGSRQCVGSCFPVRHARHAEKLELAA